MLALERQRKIIELIQREKTVKVVQLSKQFEVTEETIRRDLEKLAKQGIVQKTYGGALLVSRSEEKEKDMEDPSFDLSSVTSNCLLSCTTLTVFSL